MPFSKSIYLFVFFNMLKSIFYDSHFQMFLLRFLPHLFENDTFKSDIIEIWTKMLRNFPIIQRRDINHQILPRFFPLFKEFISTKSSLKDIFQIVKIFIDKNLRNPLHSALVNSVSIMKFLISLFY